MPKREHHLYKPLSTSERRSYYSTALVLAVVGLAAGYIASTKLDEHLHAAPLFAAVVSCASLLAAGYVARDFVRGKRHTGTIRFKNTNQ